MQGLMKPKEKLGMEESNLINNQNKSLALEELTGEKHSDSKGEDRKPRWGCLGERKKSLIEPKKVDTR